MQAKTCLAYSKGAYEPILHLEKYPIDLLQPDMKEWNSWEAYFCNGFNGFIQIYFPDKKMKQWYEKS